MSQTAEQMLDWLTEELPALQTRLAATETLIEEARQKLESKAIDSRED